MVSSQASQNSKNESEKEPSSMRVGTRYRASRLNGPYDAIVIGSGSGGMATAACLSKVGKKVLVLEQHYTAGGMSHTYTRNGYEWDVGVHFINDVGVKGSLFNKIYDFMTEGRLQWETISDEENILHVEGEKSIPIPIKHDEILSQLEEFFPEEKETIKKIVSHCDRTTLLSMPLLVANKLSGNGLVNKAILKASELLTTKDAYRSTYDVLRDFTDNEHLINTLTWWWFVFGVSIKKLPFFVYASAMQNKNGMFFPIGGASQIAESIIPVIQNTGGEVFTYAKVDEILIEKGRAIGVRMAGGEHIHAPIVISSAGANNTFRSLVPQSISTEMGITKELDKLKRSVGHLCLFVGFNEGKDTLSLPPGNYLHYPNGLVSENIDTFDADTSQEFPFLFFCFPSAKDPDWDRRHPGKSTCEIFVYLDNYEMFAEWADKPWGKRGEDYEQMKEEFSQRMLRALYQYYPDLKGKVDFYELSTPLSTKTFCLYEEGEVFGIGHNGARFKTGVLNAKTKIKGLYLTGQDSFMVGITPSTLSGVITACEILGFRQKVELINKIRRSDSDAPDSHVSLAERGQESA